MACDRLQRQYCLAPRLVVALWAIALVSLGGAISDISSVIETGQFDITGPSRSMEDTIDGSERESFVTSSGDGVGPTVVLVAFAVLMGFRKNVLCWPCEVTYRRRTCWCCCKGMVSPGDAELACARCIACPMGGRDGSACGVVRRMCCCLCCTSSTGFDQCCISEREAQRHEERRKP